jgi:plasmid stabilization system protein ParE
MGWRIALSEQAEDDLERAVAWIALHNCRAAERIGLELVAVIFSLDQFPQRGSPVRSRPGLRKVSHRHYFVYYRANETTRRVEIVRIWDGRRNPFTLQL